MMKDHQIAQLVNELRDIAINYMGTGQLRDRLSAAVVGALKTPAELEPASQPALQHVYHFVAQRHKGFELHQMDGIARLSGAVETVECYNHLKELIASDMKAPPDSLSITSLSYLGVSNA